MHGVRSSFELAFDALQTPANHSLFFSDPLSFIFLHSHNFQLVSKLSAEELFSYYPIIGSKYPYFRLVRMASLN